MYCKFSAGDRFRILGVDITNQMRSLALLRMRRLNDPGACVQPECSLTLLAAVRDFDCKFDRRPSDNNYSTETTPNNGVIASQ